MNGDLISKQALSKEIKEKVIPEKYGTSNAVLDVMGAVLRVIGEQQTAYDVEEVIRQLEKLIYRRASKRLIKILKMCQHLKYAHCIITEGI